MKIFRHLLVAITLMVGAQSAHAALVTHSAQDWTGALTPPFGSLVEAVDDFFIGSGVDYTFGNTEGVFSDPPEALCGINAAGVCDLVTAVDGRIVDLGTTNQAFTSYIMAEAGFAAEGTLTLEAFDIDGNLLASALNGPPLGPNGRTTMEIDLGGSYSIAWFRISGDDSWGMNTLTIESPVAAPEPASLALLGLGLLGVGFGRRKLA